MIGELREVSAASWQEDIGAITEMLDAVEGSPAVLFDDIPGYPRGHRVLVNANGSPPRQAVTLGLPAAAEATHEVLLAFWSEIISRLEPLEPAEVESAPVFENELTGGDVDLERFPAPIWHPLDGGRFLGTACVVALRDPEGDWVNLGTYRQQVLARDELGLYISLGHHGQKILDRYAERGERCPVASTVGLDPLVFLASCAEGIAFGTSELAWAGGLRGEPVRVVRGPVTGLPIPASAEIALEGFVEPGALRDEGPYGEWHGYYSASARPAPFMKVEAIHHRDDPILLGCPQGKPPHEDNRFLAYLKSALAAEQLRAAGVPNVRAVWCPPELGNRLLVVIAIEQEHPGHALQAGLVGGQVAATAYSGRFVVVVDDDVDVFDLDEVLWALATRCDPQRDATIVDGAWSSKLDLAVEPDRRGRNSRLILDATRPWERRHEFPEPVTNRERKREIREKWGWLLERPPDERQEETK
jgi:4-hydroxy-3-polyprenylbenzoate decarboxylase